MRRLTLSDVLCAGLPALLDLAGAALPGLRPMGVGVILADDPGRWLFAYIDAFGSTAYLARTDELPPTFRTPTSGPVVITPDEFAGNPRGLVESRLLHAGVPDEDARPHRLQQILALPLDGRVPSLLVVGLGTVAAIDENLEASLGELGRRARELLTRRESPAEEIDRLRRLEAAERVLPAFFHVLDVRQIFDRLSEITRDIVPHDFASVGIFSENLTEISLFARTSSLGVQEYSGPMPYPPSQTSSWLCRVVPDLLAQPGDNRTDPAAKVGGKSSIRVAIRSDNRTIGALNFTSCDPSRYGALDLTVARRVADYVALAMSHQRLAEEGRRAAALEERNAKLEVRVKTLSDELDSRSGFRRMAGESKPWQNVLAQAAKVASTDTTVLLLGESGTGKEVVARFLHRASRRSQGPFIALNCAALPDQLLEAELFGYERGAYTGATQSKPGQLEQAAGGTLFLDEVGDMSLPSQAKFLRVLQEREFQRLGGTRVLRSDARIVAATNRDLQRAIGQGSFREDLFYRLHVFTIQLPPLRERVDDILLLTEAFLAEFGERFGRPPAGVSRDVKQMLLEHPWPGNVRELRNSLERAAILCEGGLITPEHLALTRMAHPVRPAAVIESPTETRRSPGPPAAPGDLEIVERATIERALQQSRFNKSKAARTLGLTRQQLYVRLRRYGLD